MLKIKISSPGNHPTYDISQYVGNQDSCVDGCQFFFNNLKVQEADYWFCNEDLSAPVESCLVSPHNVYFVTAEATWPKMYYQSAKKLSFLEQFAKIFTCHAIYLPTVQYDLPFLPWMINANHGPSIHFPNERDVIYFEQLKSLQKTKLISVFCSSQNMTEDHQLRINFVKALKLHFGDKLDWYGNGVNPLEAKWDGIAPYKYHIVLENQSKNNVVTEKLYDAFLGLSFPIYYGAPNVTNYFDSQSLAIIDISDLNGSIRIIEDILARDQYAEKLVEIVKAKNLILTKYNVFKRMAKICIEDAANRNIEEPESKIKVVLRRSDQFRVVSDLKNILKKEGAWTALKKIYFYYAGRWLRMLSDKLLSKY